MFVARRLDFRVVADDVMYCRYVARRCRSAVMCCVRRTLQRSP